MTQTLTDVSVWLDNLEDLLPACDAGRVPCYCKGCRGLKGHCEPCACSAEWTGRAECAYGHVVSVLSCTDHKRMAESGGTKRLCPVCWIDHGRRSPQVFVWAELR